MPEQNKTDRTPERTQEQSKQKVSDKLELHREALRDLDAAMHDVAGGVKKPGFSGKC